MTDTPLYIHLPTIKSDNIVTIAFGYGYLNETNKAFGIGHLAEHCLCEQIKSALKPKDAWGYIDDRIFVINILLDKKGYEKLMQQGMLKTLSKLSKKILPADIKNEAMRIRSEIDERYGTAQSLFSEYVKGKLIIEPKRIARKRLGQLANMKRFSARDLESAFKIIFSTKHRIFVGTSQKMPGHQAKIAPLTGRCDVKFTSKKHIKGPADKKRHIFVGAFCAPGLDEALDKNLALGFIAKDIYQRFRESARKQGAYEPFFQHRADREFGIIWFGMYSFAPIAKSIEKSLFNAIKESLESKDIKKSLEAYKVQKIDEVKKDWADMSDRMDWIVEDYTNIGTIEGLDHAVREIKKITVKVAKKVGKDVFGREGAYIIKS